MALTRSAVEGSQYAGVVRISVAGISSGGRSTLFFYYGVDRRDELSGEEDDDRTGENRGGESIWGTLALYRKTFKSSWHDTLWHESWINIIMQLRDLPYYHHFSRAEQERMKAKRKDDFLDDDDDRPHITIKGDNEILRKKFGKFIKKQNGGT